MEFSRPSSRAASRAESPDPLAVPSSSTKPPASRRTSDRALVPTPGSARIADAFFDTPSMRDISPSKSFIMHTGRAGGSSPWKIKVTVEAQPDEGNDPDATPTRAPQSRTVTTRVPLKGADESSPVKRRGRPRKSDTMPLLKPKRDATPRRKGASRRDSEVLDLASSHIDDNTAKFDAIPSSNTSAKSKRTSDTGVLDHMDDLSNLTLESPAKGKPKRKGRRSIYPFTEEDDAELIRLKTKNFAWTDIEAYFPDHTGAAIRNRWYKVLRDQVQSEDASHSEPEDQTISLAEGLVQDAPPVALPDQMIASHESSHSTQPSDTPGSGATMDVVTEMISGMSQLSPTESAESPQAIANESTDGSERQPEDPPHIRVNDESAPTSVSKVPGEGFSRRSRRDQTGKIDLDLTKLTPFEHKTSLPENQMSTHRPRTRKSLGPKAPTPSRASSRRQAQQSSMSSPEKDVWDNEDLDEVDDTSILESEGFSMVSLDSLPSRQAAALSSPAHGRTGVEESALDDARTGRSEHEDASHVPSSPPVRNVTPFAEFPTPSVPPPIQPHLLSPSKTATPRLARVVKAGIALQGVVDVEPDTSSTSPSPQKSKAQEQKSRLDSIFSAFGEGTRRELQAGLRLGEQLARRSQSRRASRNASPAVNGDDVFQASSRTSRTSNSQRLPTPAEQSDQASNQPSPSPKPTTVYTLTVPEPQPQGNDVHYPNLSNNMSQGNLASPESEEMDWQADTTPSEEDGNSDEGEPTHPNPLLTPLQRRSVQNAGRLMHTHTAQSKKQLRSETYKNPQDETTSDSDSMSESEKRVRRAKNKQGRSDIWEEEGSRAEDSDPELSRGPQLDGPRAEVPNSVFANVPNLQGPRRGRLPKTWRRGSADNFNYSDEAEGENHLASRPPKVHQHLQTEDPGQLQPQKSASAQTRLNEKKKVASQRDEGEDSGLFWKNRRNFAQKSAPARRRPEQVDLTELLGLNDDSPARRTPVQSSPVRSQNMPSAYKSSPLKKAGLSGPPKKPPPRYAQAGPIGPTPAVSFDESVIDASESRIGDSRLHNVSMSTATSDVRQLRNEMSRLHDTSLTADTSDVRQLRNETRSRETRQMKPREDSLLEVQQRQSELRSNGAQRMQPPEGHSNSFRNHQYASHFQSKMDEAPDTNEFEVEDDPSSGIDTPEEDSSELQSQEEEGSITAIGAPATRHTLSEAQTTQSGFLSRLGNTLWSTMGYSQPANPEHPLAAKYKPLPYLHPWTKSHYRTMDALYQIFKRKTVLFLPDRPENVNLYANFPNRNKYLNATYSNWGYKVRILEQDLVLCAVFGQCLRLKDASEYERVNGEPIDYGSVCPTPGMDGEPINEGDLVLRLYSIIAGEALRADEAKGKRIRRVNNLKIVYGDGTTNFN